LHAKLFVEKFLDVEKRESECTQIFHFCCAFSFLNKHFVDFEPPRGMFIKWVVLRKNGNEISQKVYMKNKEIEKRTCWKDF
jgi:hypothetical protein